MWHMFQRQNDQIGRCHALVHIINLRCICVCVCIFARDWARCPIPKHSEGSRTQMAMLTSQFSAQRVGGAYLVITLEDLHIVQAWTQILKHWVYYGWVAPTSLLPLHISLLKQLCPQVQIQNLGLSNQPSMIWCTHALGLKSTTMKSRGTLN